jgi:hypothetical protein
MNVGHKIKSNLAELGLIHIRVEGGFIMYNINCPSVQVTYCKNIQSVVIRRNGDVYRYDIDIIKDDINKILSIIRNTVNKLIGVI